MTSCTLFQNTFILRRAAVANFADIVEIATPKSKNNQRLYIKTRVLSSFTNITKIGDFRWNYADINKNQEGGVSRGLYKFWIFFR